MLDRLYLPVLGLCTVAVIALSLVWPQGLGARSPGAFGRTPDQQTPEVQRAMQRETEAYQQNQAQARETIRRLQTQAIAPNQ
jgi:hypothetical protein